MKKFFKENGVASLLLSLVVIYIIYLLFNYLNSRGGDGMEMMNSSPNKAYGRGGRGVQSSSSVKPAEPMGQNEVFASAKGIQTTSQGIPSSCNKGNITNPSELLPKDTNSQWAQLNPSGQGMLANINLLKAGYNIGIDSVGSSLRNANQQLRSDPPCPQSNVSIWNQSTITPDFLRAPLEIGQGSQ